MTQRINVSELEVGDVIESAYDQENNLVDRNLSIDSEADLRSIREGPVSYCIVRSTGDGESASAPDNEVPAEDVLDEALGDLSELIDKTQAVYSSTVEELADVFDDLEDPDESVALDGLEPHLEELLSFIEESPASVSVLTQIQDYGETTFNHSVNVSILCLVYGHHQGFSRSKLRDLGFGALVHDIGKTNLSREIVQKERELTDEEWEIVRRHPVEGKRILEDHDTSRTVRNIAYQHHERPDGSGYPQGISDLDPLARIVSVFDVYEALTAPRPYQEALNPIRAYRRLKDQFYEFPETRRVLRGLVRGIGIFPIGCAVRLSNGDLAMVKKNRPDDLKHPVVVVLNRGDEGKLEDPYELDLQHVAEQKQMINGRLYDEVTIETVLELSKVPTLRRRIADEFKRQGF